MNGIFSGVLLLSLCPSLQKCFCYIYVFGNIRDASNGDIPLIPSVKWAVMICLLVPFGNTFSQETCTILWSSSSWYQQGSLVWESVNPLRSVLGCRGSTKAPWTHSAEEKTEKGHQSETKALRVDRKNAWTRTSRQPNDKIRCSKIQKM